MNAIKLTVLIAVLAAATGCEQQALLESLGQDNFSVDDPTPDTCDVSSMVLNGAQAADPDKTNYFCYFDDDDSAFVFAVRTDTGAFVRFGSDPETFVRWKRTEDPCKLTFYVHPSGADLYTLTNLTLNTDDTVDGGTFTNLSNGAVRTFSECYYDETPGF